MRIAELFVELGFKVQGADKLKAFETSLTNAASAATRLVVAMRMLAGLKVPDAYKNLRAIKMSSAGPQPPVLNQPGTFDQPDTGTGIQKGLKDISKLLGIMGLAGILKSLITGLKNMVRDSLKAQMELNQFSKQTGMSRQEFKKWQYLVNKVGMSQQELEQQIIAINTKAFQISRGERLPSGPLAVEEAADFETVLRQFEAATRNFTPAQQTAFARDYGFDPRLVTALRDFPNAFDEFSKTFELTKQQEQNLNDLNEALNDLQMVVTERVTQAFSELAPLLLDVVRVLQEFVKTPTEFLQKHAEQFQFGARFAGGALPTTIASNVMQLLSDFTSSKGRGNNTVNVYGVDTNNANKVGNAVIERVFSDNAYQTASDYFAAQTLFATP